MVTFKLGSGERILKIMNNKLDLVCYSYNFNKNMKTVIMWKTHISILKFHVDNDICILHKYAT